MANDRKVFPVEQVLELVTNKKGANVEEIASFITGRSGLCPECQKAAAPFASAWLARWYPDFMTLEWKDGLSWDGFVKQVKNKVGDNISLTPISGKLKELTDQALDAIKETQESLNRQTEAALQLEKEVAALKPFEARAAEAQKKCDQLEETIKTMKSDMNALRRKTAEYDGKVAIDHDELLQSIRDTIKDGLKNISIAGAVAGTVAAAASADSSDVTKGEQDFSDDFGFGSSKKSDDEFGF